MIAILCPGQGSQTPGFMTPWLEIQEYREVVEGLSDTSGIDLIAHGTVSDADTIRDTAVAQPLIVAAGIATIATLRKLAGDKFGSISGVAGHSVGEVTAAYVANIFSAETAIKFVKERGNAMALAAALEHTSMAAVLGGETSDVVAALSAAGLHPANFNGSGQIVAAGSAERLGEFMANPPTGVRVIQLQVAGAFHTAYMQPAVKTLTEFAKQVRFNDPDLAIWSNREGALVTTGQEFVDRLVSQVSSPVRWELCMEAMGAAGVTRTIELVPGGTLSGLAKRAMPGVEALALKTPENLDSALAVLQNR